MHTNTTVFQASVFHIKAKPCGDMDKIEYEFFENGALVVENGVVTDLGQADAIFKTLPDHASIVDYSDKIIMPGFIDTHIHCPQTDIIASHGKQLMDWLKTYTFPCEKKFKDPEHAREVADFFINELASNGTTTAVVLGTVHSESVNAFFEKADAKNMRMIAGKVMMDRNAPDYLLDTAESSYLESKALIDTWHKKNRLLYAVTPRFAVTSSEKQLEAAQTLINEYDDIYLHTHLAENKQEVEMISTMYPWSSSYLNVYDRFGLVGKNSIFAHSIHLDDNDYQRMKETGAAISLCPTSNLFLGSGFFDLKNISDYSIKTGFGTDVGGGTSFSMLKTMAEAYKVCQLKGFNFSPLHAFYMATLGGADSLNLDDKIGNFNTGKEADFIVIDPAASPLLKRRSQQTESVEELLFTLMILGDDRHIEATYIAGRKYEKNNRP